MEAFIHNDFDERTDTDLKKTSSIRMFMLGVKGFGLSRKKPRMEFETNYNATKNVHMFIGKFVFVCV